jgi:tetratricopeptide (TPR) repeat protein
MRKFVADPESAEAINIEAYSDADRLFHAGRYREALRLFELAANAEPDDGQAHLAVGNCWGALGKAARAEASYRKAAHLLPENERPGAIYNLANAVFDQGRYEEAIILYKGIPKGTRVWELARKNLERALERIGE